MVLGKDERDYNGGKKPFVIKPSIKKIPRDGLSLNSSSHPREILKDLLFVSQFRDDKVF